MKLFPLLFALSLAAAEPHGHWYGTLNTPGGALRVAIHIVKSDAGVSATLDSLDQGGTGLVASAAKVEGAKVTLEFAALRGKFEGEANGEATELNGTWSQGPGTLPLKLTRTPFPAAKPVTPVPITAQERDFLLSHLEKSRKEFLASIDGLTTQQWTFKTAPDRWSIAECAEHIAKTEELLFNLVSGQFLKIPLKEGARMGAVDDEKVIARTLDRSQKAKAPEVLHPSGKFGTPDTIPPAFNPLRDRTIAWVKSTQEDLRGRRSGPMDVYQYVVMLSAHTLRHTAQLNEVKADPNYPK